MLSLYRFSGLPLRDSLGCKARPISRLDGTDSRSDQIRSDPIESDPSSELGRPLAYSWCRMLRLFFWFQPPLLATYLGGSSPSSTWAGLDWPRQAEQGRVGQSQTRQNRSKQDASARETQFLLICLVFAQSPCTACPLYLAPSISSRITLTSLFSLIHAARCGLLAHLPGLEQLIAQE